MSSSRSRRGKKFPPKDPEVPPAIRHAIGAIPQLAWSASPEGFVEFCNQHWLECTGLAAKQAQGWGWQAAIHPEDLDGLVARWRRVLAEGVPGEAEARMRMADGNYRWFHIRATPQRDEQGRIVKWYGTNTGIDEQKRTVEKLRESEQRFRLVADTAPVLIWMSDTDKLCTYVNKPWLDFTGRPIELELGNGWAEGVHVEDLRQCMDTYTQAFDRREEFRMEYRLRRHDGEYRWILDIGVPRFNLERSLVGYIGIAVDVTERKRMESALRESKDRLRLLLDSTAEAIYGIDLKGRCTFCNPACLRALGYERVDELLGKNLHQLTHPTRPDGTFLSVEECRICRAFQTGEGVHVEDEVLWRENGTSFPAEYWSHPQRRGQEIVGAVVAFIDITKRKQAEEVIASVNRRLIEAQEKERTRIARELHDDTSQRLALLALGIEQLKNDLPRHRLELRRRLDDLQKEAWEISDDVQSLSHELHSPKLDYLGLVPTIRSFCKDFGLQQSVKVEFTSHDVPTDLPRETSLCLFRVLQEALHNSAKYSGAEQFDVQLWGTSDEIHLTVSDFGIGFELEAAIREQGLGLVSMRERVQLLKGKLSIDSHLHRGTTIHARLPLTSKGDFIRLAG
jgi:PAS domain S-box-containing protein